MNSNSLVIKQKQKQRNKIYNEDQAKEFCSVRETGFCYSYFTVRITTNPMLLPLFH